VKRVWSTAVTAAGAVLLVSLFLNAVPGDPVDVMLGEQSSTVDREALRHAVGLDLPWYRQLGRFTRELATGELRTSLPPFERKVVPQILHALPYTFALALGALLVALALAIPFGVSAAAHPGGWTVRAAMAASVAGAAVPRFWLGPMLIILFALKLDWLPVSGADSPAHVVLPAVTLGTALAALLSRMTRASMLEALGEDFVRSARAKGASPRAVLWRHAFSNALLPVVTVLGLELGALLGGAIVTEKVFAWPGIGTLLLNGIQQRDYNLVRGCVLTLTLSYVAINALTDWLSGRLDPRVRG